MISSFFIIFVGYVNCQEACEKSLTTTSGTHAPGRVCSGNLIFEENFDDLDLAVWEHEKTLSGGGNWEFQWYTNNRTNSYVENGILHVRPTFTADEFGNNFLYSGTLDLNGGGPADKCTDASNWGCSRTGTAQNIINPAKSARLRTSGSFNFKYGTMEVRAKVPAGDWLWPAIWLLPRWDAYGTWPASGEIDLLESRGNKDLVSPSGTNIGTQQVSSTLHFGPNPANNRYTYAHYEKQNPDGYDTDFHLYKLQWTPDGITFHYDDQIVGTLAPPVGGFWELGRLNGSGLSNPWNGRPKMAPFDQEFYIIVNLAVGGVNGFFPDDAKNPRGKPWKNTSPHAPKEFWEAKDLWAGGWNVDGDDTSHLQVDYVRVWAL